MDEETLGIILNEAPEEWDGDESGESIATMFVHHLVSEVKRLGGCLKPYCSATDPDEPTPCNHGYRLDHLKEN